jgi:hypothetical protein
MIGKLRPLIFLISFALLIQNTCPFGAAGKSTVAAMFGHCCLYHNLFVSSNGQKNLVSENLSIHIPPYVFAAPKTINTLRLYPVKSVQPALTDQYKDISQDELLRPPGA